MSLQPRNILATSSSVLKFFFNKTDDVSGFVVDASISGVKDVNVLLDDISKQIDGTDDRIILTNVTIDELDRLQKRRINHSDNARAILSAATDDESHSHYMPVEIDTSFNLADDCILHYCEKHRRSVILLTADKGMTLKAEPKRIATYFFDLSKEQDDNQRSSITTLYPTKKVDGNLYLTPNFNSVTTEFCVISNGTKLKVLKMYGSQELHIGDDVLIAKYKKEKGFVSLSHFRIISLFEEENAELIYTTRIYNSDDVSHLDAFYRSFIEDFRYTRNIQ